MTNNGPFPSLTPELLAQLSASGFRPPGQAPAPGLMSAMAPPEFGIGQGLAMLQFGLSQNQKKKQPEPGPCFLTGRPPGFPADLWNELFGGGS